MINDKGSALNEVLIVLVVCLSLSSFFFILILERVREEQFRTLKNDLNLITSSGNLYQLEDNNKSVSLKELVDHEVITEVKSPFNQKESCDLYESRIEMNNQTKETILRCSNYLITKKSNEDKATIYKVSDWQEENKPKMNVKVGYNYIKDSKLMLKDYYEDYMFLYLFNKHNNTSYDRVSSIPEKYNVINQVLYRTKVKIKEI